MPQSWAAMCKLAPLIRQTPYIARQLYDLQIGARNGAWSDLMGAAVANLTVEDIVNIAAYTGSLEPKTGC